MADPVLRGSTAIAKALGCSARTVQRLTRKNVLPCRKLGERTSPLTITRKQLDVLRRGRRDEEA